MSSKSAQKAAERLESLLPQVMGALFPHVEDDPLGHLPVGQLRLLRLLSQGPQSVTDLANRLHLSLSALTQMGNRLVAAGLVVKVDAPEDRRVRLLSLSQEAERMLAVRSSCRARSALAALAALPDEKLHVLVGLLEEVAASRPSPDAPEAPRDPVFI
jgi:DNA-binding MarR family transcriptional regulator